MAKRPDRKMTNEERAKQFSPFSALRGLELALLKKEKEKMLTARKLIADDKEEELDKKLNLIGEGDLAEVVYYRRGEYLKISGWVKTVDKIQKLLKISDKTIRFSDIAEIRIK